MEVPCFNAVVAESKKTMRQENFSIPAEVAEVVDAIFERHPRWKTRKWWLYVAALLDLISTGDEEVKARVERVAGAAAIGDMQRLVREALEAAARSEGAAEPGAESKPRFYRSRLMNQVIGEIGPPPKPKRK